MLVLDNEKTIYRQPTALSHNLRLEGLAESAAAVPRWYNATLYDAFINTVFVITGSALSVTPIITDNTLWGGCWRRFSTMAHPTIINATIVLSFGEILSLFFRI